MEDAKERKNRKPMILLSDSARRRHASDGPNFLSKIDEGKKKPLDVGKPGR